MNIQGKDTSKGHFYVSLFKSVIRIAAGIALLAGGLENVTITYALFVSGAFLILAEGLGIVEELV